MSNPITPSSGGCRLDAYSSKVISAIWYPPAQDKRSKKRDCELFRPLESRQQGRHAGKIRPAGNRRELSGIHENVKHRGKEDKTTSSTRPNGPGGQAGTREAQAESEVLFSANAHTQLNPRHGRDQHSEAACAASSNIAQPNKMSNPYFGPHLS